MQILNLGLITLQLIEANKLKLECHLIPVIQLQVQFHSWMWWDTGDCNASFLESVKLVSMPFEETKFCCVYFVTKQRVFLSNAVPYRKTVFYVEDLNCCNNFSKICPAILVKHMQPVYSLSVCICTVRKCNDIPPALQIVYYVYTYVCSKVLTIEVCELKSKTLTIKETFSIWWYIEPFVCLIIKCDNSAIVCITVKITQRKHFLFSVLV